MAHENFPDQPLNREAIVASYPAEMITARDALTAELTALRDRAIVDDATGRLPSRVDLMQYETGEISLALGSFSDDIREAMTENRAAKTLAAMSLDLSGARMPGSEIMVATFAPPRPAAEDSAAFPVIEQPRVKLDWSDKVGDETIANHLSVYDDGYVESSQEVTTIHYEHAPDASDMMRQYAKPTVAHEIDVVPPITQPAALADVQNASSQLQGTLARYGYSQ